MDYEKEWFIDERLSPKSANHDNEVQVIQDTKHTRYRIPCYTIPLPCLQHHLLDVRSYQWTLTIMNKTKVGHIAIGIHV